jgi:hypothetical protein
MRTRVKKASSYKCALQRPVTAGTNKEMVIRKVREMPDRASLQEIAEEVAILALIEEGERAADEGRVISHEELKRQVKQWLSSS